VGISFVYEGVEKYPLLMLFTIGSLLPLTKV